MWLLENSNFTCVACVIFLLDSPDLEPVRSHMNSLMAETQVHHGIVTRLRGESKKLELDGKRRRKS